jgi:signal transduction histidine kinase
MADEQKLLFTPFFSTESVMKHSSGRYKYKGGGLGLGLTVANMIMDYYGGAIRMKNLLETGGMKFTLKLPLLTWGGSNARG